MHPIHFPAIFNEDFSSGRRGGAVAEQPGASGLALPVGVGAKEDPCGVDFKSAWFIVHGPQGIVGKIFE